MRSQKNILFKKTVLPISIENESLYTRPKNKNLPVFGSICIEGSHLRASGSAPNLCNAQFLNIYDVNVLVKKPITSEEYQQSKKISSKQYLSFIRFHLEQFGWNQQLDEKRVEVASHLLLKNIGIAKTQSQVKLLPLTTTNTRQTQLPSLSLPLTTITKSTMNHDFKVKIESQSRQMSTKKLKPLNILDIQQNKQMELEVVDQQNQDIQKQKKKKKKKNANTNTKESIIKRVYSTREALVEIIKIIQELEIIVEGDISSEDLLQIIDNLMKVADEVRREMSLCTKEESFNLIYEKVHPKVFEATQHLEFSHQYQYISKKFTEVLIQTPYTF